jgi:predicted dehydrogenase
MINFGILGCGRITNRGMIPGLLGSRSGRLRALASRRPGMAAQVALGLAAQAAGVICHDSYEAVLSDPDVQAVYIPATGDEHALWAIRAAEAGKHVLCEKPLATSVAEAERMIAACHRAGVRLQEAFMWRHHPRSKRVKQLLEEGAIGELRQINASFSFKIAADDWRLDAARGGGAVWDVGCYGVNASRFFAGAEPVAIHAAGRFNDRGADLSMQLALRFPGDVFANIDCSFEVPYRCQVELVGTQGTIEVPAAFLPPPQAALLVRRGTTPADAPERVVFEPANQYVEQVHDFCASIAAGRLLPPAESGLGNMRVLETAVNIARRP